jgi:hypothetical protein
MIEFHPDARPTAAARPGTESSQPPSPRPALWGEYPIANPRESVVFRDVRRITANEYPMKTTSTTTASKRGKGRFLESAIVLAVSLIAPHAPAAVIELGSAEQFAILAGAGITIAGPVNSTIVTGDIGTFPTPSITGTENLVLTGTNHGADAVTQIAKNDLMTAYLDAVSRPADISYGAGHTLMGTLFSGVYNSTTSFSIDSHLILDAQGDPNAVWIFQAGSTLITASNSIVELTGGAKASNVFWQVGSSATLGTYADFVGNIMALESITLNTGATLIHGRALAHNGAVTMDNNIIDNRTAENNITLIPEPGNALLLCSVLMLGIFTRRMASRSR